MSGEMFSGEGVLVTAADKEDGNAVYRAYLNGKLEDAGGDYEGEECAIHAFAIARHRLATQPAPSPVAMDETGARFLTEIHKRTPDGEWIAVQHIPDGSWSVAKHPLPWLPGGEVATPAQPEADADPFDDCLGIHVQANARRFAATAPQPTIPPSMVEWFGGDSAPGDFDTPGGKVLLRNGVVVNGAYRWTHCSDDQPAGTRATDVIAYTPRATPIPQPADQGLEARAREVLEAHGLEVLQGGSLGFRSGVLPGAAILAALLAFRAEGDAEQRAAVEAERERCARLVETFPLAEDHPDAGLLGCRDMEIATAIRSDAHVG